MVSEALKKARAALNKAEEKKERAISGGGDNAQFRFWEAQQDSLTVLRFLPDHPDAENDLFWVERSVFKFPFHGIVGAGEQDTEESLYIQVPCIEMYDPDGKTKDPVLEILRGYWKKSKKGSASRDEEEWKSTYWPKKSWLYQGFVVKSEVQEESPPDNPIRRFNINKDLHNFIKPCIMDDELDELPCDFDQGIDFKIRKTLKDGKHNNYIGEWARKTRELDDDERAAIEEHGLFNLREYLPKEPNDEELKVIFEMFEASKDMEPYDYEKWGAFFTPPGLSLKDRSATKTQVKSVKDDDEDDDEDERPRKSSKRVVEDDEDERPRKPSRRVVEDDDEDEEPRSKKSSKRIVEDDEDEDERPRKSSRRVVDDDDDDEDERPRKSSKRVVEDDEDDNDVNADDPDAVLAAIRKKMKR